MLKDITIGQYLPGNSFLHKLDPRTKILAVLLYMIALFVVNNFWGLGAMLLLSVVVILISKIPLRFFFRGIKAIAFIETIDLIKAVAAIAIAKRLQKKGFGRPFSWAHVCCCW